MKQTKVLKTREKRKNKQDEDIGSGSKKKVKKATPAANSNGFWYLPSLATSNNTYDGTLAKTTLGSEPTTTTGSFKLPLTAEEIKRRKERMARFANTRTATSSDVTDRKSLEPKNRLDLPLAALRSSTNGSLNKKSNAQKSGAKSPGNMKRQASKDQDDDDNDDENENAFVGENTNLEKPYLRLTTFPRKEDVRPLEVLIRSLAHIKNRYIQTEDFTWTNEQMKSLRQDLTVQRIRKPFVLDVYETHARILLEHGDLSEFNQCQTVLRTLTQEQPVHNDVDDDVCGYGCVEDKKKAEGSEAQLLDQPWQADFASSNEVTPLQNQTSAKRRVALRQTEEAEDEFHGYAILYALVRNSYMELKKELSRQSSIGRGLSSNGHEGAVVWGGCNHYQNGMSDGGGDSDSNSSGGTGNRTKSSSRCHAMQVVRAVLIDHDYRTFFRLYEAAPHLSAYLMDFLVHRVREDAYKRIVSAYRPTISIEQIRDSLHFSSLEETRRFLKQQKVVYVKENVKGGGTAAPFWVDCKKSHKQGKKCMVGS